MKSVLAALITILLVAICSLAFGVPPIPPLPTDWVTDTAGFLSEPTRQTLNTRLESYEHKTGHQVLVWVGKTTGETPLEDWTVKTFRAWRVGRKGLDDGLILFIFADDHKVRIEVGYGLEGQMPDATASRIINEVVIPRIKSGDHDGAAISGVDQMLTTLGGEGAAVGTAAAPSKPLTRLQMLFLSLFVIVLIMLAIRYPVMAFYLFSLITRRGGDGGGFGGGGGRSGGGGASGKW